MKKLLSLFFLSSSLFISSNVMANQDQIELNLNKTFEQEIENDILSVYASVRIEEVTEKKALEKLKPYQEYLKSKNEEIKNISLSITPVYVYDKIKKDNNIKSYQSMLSFSILTKNNNAVNEINNKMLELKDRDYNINISLSDYSWVVSEDTRKKISKELEKEAIDWSLTPDISDKLDCKVSKIVLNTNYFMPVRGRNMMAFSKVADEGSIDINKGKNNIAVNVSYKFLCNNKNM